VIGLERIDARLQPLAAALGIGEADVEPLRLIGRLVDPYLESLVADLETEPAMVRLFGQVPPERRPVLRAKQCAHWRRLFDARLDREYGEQVHRSALAHKMIGLAPEDYVLSYCMMRERIAGQLRTCFGAGSQAYADHVTALGRFVSLDIVLTLRAYTAGA
jgi:hypothetical protein